MRTASTAGNTAALRSLLDNFGHSYWNEITRQQVLIDAAHMGHLECVRVLWDALGQALSSEMVSAPDALRIAASRGHVDIVSFLLPATTQKDQGRALVGAAK